MLIYVRAGLCNRLRSIIGCWYIAECKKENIIVHWEINDLACNGLFSDLFLPFVEKNIQIEYITRNKETTYDYTDVWTAGTIIKNLGKDLKMKLLTEPQVEKKYYKRFHTHPILLSKVNAFVKNKDFISIHIRRTDHSILAKKNNVFTEDHIFHSFIQKYPEYSVYLATDDYEIQESFKQTYPTLFYHHPVSKETKNRCTSLEHAWIDILICSRATYFQGSGWSSFSHLIRVLQKWKLFRK